MTNIPGNTSTTAAITATGSQFSAIDFVGDSDWFRLNVTQPGLTYRFYVSGDGSANELTNIEIAARDQFGNELGSYRSGDSSTAEFGFDSIGTYYIEVRSYFGDSGRYYFEYDHDDLQARNTSTNQTLGLNQTVNEEIEVFRDSDWFRINLNAGRTYSF